MGEASGVNIASATDSELKWKNGGSRVLCFHTTIINGIPLTTLYNSATTNCTASIQRDLYDLKDWANRGLMMLRPDFWRNSSPKEGSRAADRFLREAAGSPLWEAFKMWPDKGPATQNLS